MKKVYALILGLALVQATAWAEMIAGTVTNVNMDGQKVSIMRSDNQEEIVLSVNDSNSIAALQIGDQVTVEASRGLLGGWSAEAVTPASGTAADASAGASMGGPSDASAMGSSDSSIPADGSSAAASSPSAVSSGASGGGVTSGTTSSAAGASGSSTGL